MRKIIGINILFIIVLSSKAQYHNNYKYLIDAAVFTDDSALYFVAHEYPLFYDQAHDSIAMRLNEKMKENNPFQAFELSESIREVSTLYGLETNELLDAKSLFQMLRNRIGLADFQMSDTSYLANIVINKAEFPDLRNPFFNHRVWLHDKASSDKDFKGVELLQVLDARSAEALTVGNWGGEKAMICLEAVLKQQNLDKSKCEETSFDKIWKSGDLIDWEVHELVEQTITLSTTDVAIPCEEWKQDAILVLDEQCGLD